LYTWILGGKIGIADLNIISPQLVASLDAICNFDDDFLSSEEMRFTVTINSSIEYDLVLDGATKVVTTHNRMDYLFELLKFYFISIKIFCLFLLDFSVSCTCPGCHD
jgi:hypothetical protein